MKYREKVLKAFEAHGKEWDKGETYRIVDITERDAAFLNSRKKDFGFEYIKIKEDEAIEETMETEKPKRGFPKKKQ